MEFYPNPLKNGLAIVNPVRFKKAKVYAIEGKFVMTHSLIQGMNVLECNLELGMNSLNLDEIKVGAIRVEQGHL